MKLGLFSMLQFCLAVCMRVFKPLKEKYPEFYPKAIFNTNAWPRRGGEAPPTPPVDFE